MVVVVAERTQGGVVCLVKVCCSVPLLCAANAWGFRVHKATTTHPGFHAFELGEKEGARGREANECAKCGQEAKVCVVVRHGKGKKGRHSQNKTNETSKRRTFCTQLLVPLAHICTRRVVCSGARARL